jgi:peptidase E
MAKLYFLGGENVAIRDAKEINASAIADSGAFPKVLVFSWAKPSFDRFFSRRKRFANYLRTLGAESISFAEYADNPEGIAAKVSSANLIYLTGGQPRILMVRLKKVGVDRLLEKYSGVIVGRSAGALVMGKNFLVTNRYSRTHSVVEGLGMVDFSIKAHYDPSQDRLIRDFSCRNAVYAIPQGSALVYHDGVLSSFGSVFLFKNGEKTSFSSKTEF